MIITIDGPSGTGKSTVAKAIAKKLRFTFFDTGAMYRTFAWRVVEENIDPEDQEAVEKLIPDFHFDIRVINPEKRRYYTQGVDVTDRIRSSQISIAASKIAVYPDVRKAMVAIQRKFGRSSNAVFEGRDMGTVVFPDADLKIFLTASLKTRAERRYQELIHKFPDVSLSREEIYEELRDRDDVDTTRLISPLKQAEDAVLIDTTRLSVQQVIEEIIKLSPRQKPKMKFSYKIVYWTARIFFKLFYRLKIYGVENVRSGAAIIAANHVSFYDPPVLSISCPEEVHFLAKESLFRIPLFGRFIKMLNAHPVARGASDASVFRSILGILKEGKKVIVFPEGNRSQDGAIQPLEKGLGFLVQKSQCRVIPAYIEGTFSVWPKGRAFPKPFGRITVVFGTVIEGEFSEDKKRDQKIVLEKTKTAIEALKYWLEQGKEGFPP